MAATDSLGGPHMAGDHPQYDSTSSVVRYPEYRGCPHLGG